MSKHTPGPWTVYECACISPDMAKAELSNLVDGTQFVPVLPMVVGSNGLCTAVTGCGPTSIANARLIAAAPAMLQALERLIEAGGNLRTDLRTVQGMRDMSNLLEATDAARAAIRAAKGEA